MTLVLRKLGKLDYTVPGAHQPITLINMLGKVLLACVMEDLVHMLEIQTFSR